MIANCLCGSVSVTIDAKPDFIFDCNCSLCRKTGSAWGYFKPEAVATDGETVGYARSDKTFAAVDVHSCKPPWLGNYLFNDWYSCESLGLLSGFVTFSLQQVRT